VRGFVSVIEPIVHVTLVAREEKNQKIPKEKKKQKKKQRRTQEEEVEEEALIRHWDPCSEHHKSADQMGGNANVDSR
jgi:hypothetical protein